MFPHGQTLGNDHVELVNIPTELCLPAALSSEPAAQRWLHHLLFVHFPMKFDWSVDILTLGSSSVKCSPLNYLFRPFWSQKAAMIKHSYWPVQNQTWTSQTVWGGGGTKNVCLINQSWEQAWLICSQSHGGVMREGLLASGIWLLPGVGLVCFERCSYCLSSFLFALAGYKVGHWKTKRFFSLTFMGGLRLGASRFFFFF